MLRASTIVIGPLSHETAAIMAQVLPALLVAGLLGPLISGVKLDSSSRKFFALSVVIAVVAEGICLISVMTRGPIPLVGTLIVLVATAYSLVGILTYPLGWARRSLAEKAEADAVKQRRATEAEAEKERRAAKAGVRAERRAARRRHKKLESERLKHPVQSRGPNADQASDVDPVGS